MTGAAGRERARQTLIGLGLAGAIVSAWLALHVLGVFFWRWTPLTIALTPVMIAVQSWLGAGLFIVAHDAMHGTLAPGRRKLGAAVGQFCLGVYAGFSFAKLNAAHHRHHRAPGTADDPDFHAPAPTAFWPWYVTFFRTYFGWKEMAVLGLALGTYLFILRAPPLNTALFWGVPAILSSLQLFAFGTWLPHRHEGEGAFVDEHRARTLEFGWLTSLLTCFHFGYHLEHHLSPQSPWWRLPAVRAATRTSEPGAGVAGRAEPFTVS